MADQSFAKHSRYITGYHFVLFPILMINVFVAIYAAYAAGFSKTAIWNILLAVGLVLLAWFSRVMPLTAQNRIIRLEERMRMHDKLPAHLRDRAHEIPPGHLVGLRFASDDELPALAERCLNGEFKNGQEVKAAIKTWRPDYLRV